MREEAAAEARYRRKLIGLLSAATFFEGYDGYVFSFVLAQVLTTYGGTERTGGVIRAITIAGTVAAFFLATQADRIGRRRLLLITVTGYTVMTALTSAAPTLVWYTVAQFLAQVFLGAEWAAAVTMVVEEYPQDRRGRALGILTSMGTLGGISVGLLGFAGFMGNPLGWRAFYLVGLIPLVVVAIGRRGLRETRRYEAATQAADLNRSGIFEPWKPEFRHNVLAVGLTHFFRYLAVSAGVAWWVYYAEKEAHMSVSLTGLYLAIAGVVGALGFVIAGRLMDRFGRKPTFLTYVVMAGILGTLLFQTHAPGPMLPLLCGTIFFGLGSGAATTAFATECFPTYVRGRAATWCRNAFEVPGGIFGPLIVGFLGDHRHGAIGSIGGAASLLFLVCTLPVIVIAWKGIAETKGLDLGTLDPVSAPAAAG
ncbi:MAG: transporter, putative metabolite:H+ symporter [Actinomycetota bacterium]|nr:transporter, putative metabolite:H+ symporter [Actinomycetota bacterium]